MVPIASSPRLLMKYVRNTRSPSRKNTLWPCHSSTPKSVSKLSVMVYHGISQPIRTFSRVMSSCCADDGALRSPVVAETGFAALTGGGTDEDDAAWTLLRLHLHDCASHHGKSTIQVHSQCVSPPRISHLIDGQLIRRNAMIHHKSVEPSIMLYGRSD